jgi:uncharacterized transporter YbjL
VTGSGRHDGAIVEPEPGTVIRQGDVVAVERAARDLGYADRPTITTDMIFVGLGIFVGGLIGLLTVMIGDVTAVLRALQEESRSKLPALGYAVPYAIGNILLTEWGPVIVALMR